MFPYTNNITVNGTGDYTISFYAVDNLNNIEPIQTENFTLVERPETYAGEISGYTFFDVNQDQIWNAEEETIAGWKVCIDVNNNGECEENLEPFVLTNNT